MTTLLLETASQNPALACQFAFILVHLDDPRLLRSVLARLPAAATSRRALLSTHEDTNVQEARLVANALTSIGSGNEFVMNNGNWVKKAESWTKFGIIASFALVRTDGRCQC